MCCTKRERLGGLVLTEKQSRTLGGAYPRELFGEGHVLAAVVPVGPRGGGSGGARPGHDEAPGPAGVGVRVAALALVEVPGAEVRPRVLAAAPLESLRPADGRHLDVTHQPPTNRRKRSQINLKSNQN
eukprot:1184786-Prorocentrum_minimum.AAC.3